MIQDLFKIPNILSGKQIGWLDCMSTIPAVKLATGMEVLTEDTNISVEAKSILKEKTNERRNNNKPT